MAIVKYPPGSNGLNKSRQGATFTRNSSGSIIRRKVKPLLKRTYNTSRSRASFRNVVTSYRLLSDLEKADWRAKTVQFPRFNSLGVPYQMKGNNLYQGLNQNRVNSDLPINEIAADAILFPARIILPWAMDVSPVDVDVTLDNPQIPEGFEFQFWVTYLYDTEYNFSFPNDFKFIKSFNSGSYVFFDLSLAWQNVYGPGPQVINVPPDSVFLRVVLQAVYLASGQSQILDSFSYQFSG